VRIECIDVYRAKLPLAFVWKTSYGDQHVRGRLADVHESVILRV